MKIVAFAVHKNSQLSKTVVPHAMCISLITRNIIKKDRQHNLINNFPAVLIMIPFVVAALVYPISVFIYVKSNMAAGAR